jgi:hypothetical protein
VEDNSDTLEAREKSAVALDIEKLQDTVKRLAAERERLPQPLFWSLFHTRLEAIRQQKELSRVVKETLGES